MTGAEEMRERHRRLLGDDVLEHIRASVAAAPPPPPELVEELRRIFTQPAGEVPAAVPAPTAQAA
ncbi:hypothetical protein PUR59_04415 [Streptomyces sp. SP18ES09]|uniref:hypothetical protein n=1 Tax=Streptomyces sp. SP18ES09 TaxID=3002532 RepID=UPI002E7939CD|nr:hypothetical protein [Streptomyces sp. SP18ES09]MEE1814265.1 hypothetical protein [Streptomyces sp. SP18ES09]